MKPKNHRFWVFVEFKDGDKDIVDFGSKTEMNAWFAANPNVTLVRKVIRGYEKEMKSQTKVTF